MLVLGIKDVIENGFNLVNTLTIIAGLLAAGIGISLLTGSWIPLLIAGFLAALVALVSFTGHGEELMGGRTRPSVVSDAFEALIAAMYLDGGIKPVSKFILRFVDKQLKQVEAAPLEDYKTRLQEIIQQNPEERVHYVLVKEEGPDHDKKFVVEVRLNSNVIGRGTDRSKKGAEQLAAKEALELMGE